MPAASWTLCNDVRFWIVRRTLSPLGISMPPSADDCPTLMVVVWCTWKREHANLTCETMHSSRERCWGSDAVMSHLEGPGTTGWPSLLDSALLQMHLRITLQQFSGFHHDQMPSLASGLVSPMVSKDHDEAMVSKSHGIRRRDADGPDFINIATEIPEGLASSTASLRVHCLR